MMNRFLLNLILTALYLMLLGQVSFFNFAAGFVMSAVIVSMVSRAMGQDGYLKRMFTIVFFGIYFLYILIKANVEVAWEIVTPGFSMNPRIIRYPVGHLSPAQLTALASAITLTPGTLSADVDDNGEMLYVHCMYAEDRDAAIAELDALRIRLEEEVFA